jgi:hypothetical protein
VGTLAKTVKGYRHPFYLDGEYVDLRCGVYPMSAQIINLHAWRVAHSERPALCLELLRVWMWPVRVWLAWWGVR